MDKIDWNKPVQIRLNGVWIDVNNEGRIATCDSISYVRNKPEPRYTWLNVYAKGSYCAPFATHNYEPTHLQVSKGYIHTLKVNLDTGETEKITL